MKRVDEQPKPTPPVFDFDNEVRTPGRRLLMELRGDPNAPKRSGPKRRPVAKITSAHLTDFWTRALPTLAETYGHVCAYCCLRIDPETGSRTVDHWKPKDAHPDDAYEWDNFRYATLTMNRRKGIDETLCDPFEVQDEWFVLNLVNFALSPAPDLPPALGKQVQHTIDVLELDGEPMRKRREAAWNLFFESPTPYTWSLMERDCPLVASQYVRMYGAPPPTALRNYAPG